GTGALATGGKPGYSGKRVEEFRPRRSDAAADADRMEIQGTLDELSSIDGERGFAKRGKVEFEKKALSVSTMFVARAPDAEKDIRQEDGIQLEAVETKRQEGKLTPT
ncbi:hypothetical protein TGPRC2_200595B, partial [Toxoplasma gondii TgCatPRC2]